MLLLLLYDFKLVQLYQDIKQMLQYFYFQTVFRYSGLSKIDRYERLCTTYRKDAWIAGRES